MEAEISKPVSVWTSNLNMFSFHVVPAVQADSLQSKYSPVGTRLQD